MAHTYWRLISTRDNNGGFSRRRWSLKGLELRDTIGGSNVATGGTPTASTTRTFYSAAGALLPYANPALGWASGLNEGDIWWKYQFAAPVEIEEVSITGYNAGGDGGIERKFYLQYSDNDADWTTKFIWTTLAPWANGEVRDFNVNNADIYPNIWQLRAISLVNFPASEVQATSYHVTTLMRQMAQVRMTSMRAISLVRGRVANPKLRAWWFDLDEHSYYVLRLGDAKTLVYDVSTKKWSWWSSGLDEFWRAAVGTNWTESGSNAYLKGSDVVVGDDTFGILWVLDPMQGYDEPPSETARNAGQIIPFPRTATGQVVARGRNFLPCYAVYLACDPGAPAFTGAAITLSYSDDGGRSYVSAGTITAEEGNFGQEFVWRSLGIISAPGRMFRIDDNGAVRQIDELSIHNG